MSKQIGFVILSHDNPQQLLRLVRCLQRIYDDPPIAIHHDFTQCPLCRNDFPSDVKFVSPHVNTRWGKFSLVTAVLRGIELLYQSAAPDWFVLLSGADYPTMSADVVLKELGSSEVDALIDYREVPNLSDSKHRISYGISISKYSARLGASEFDSPYPTPENPALQHFVRPDNLALAWCRYVGLYVWLPVIRIGPRIGRYIVYLPFDDWRSPFTRHFTCLYGDMWFAGNHKVAEILINPTDVHMRLRRHLRTRPVPDECYYQTILGNTPSLKTSKATKRFVDWSDSAGGPHGGSHPRVLSADDLTAIISSKAYFARKFAPESPVLDELDRILS